MAFVEINPDYRPYLERHGLTAARHFLDLPGVVVCGHPNRHVVQVEVGPGLRGFLKREHRVFWKDRHLNAWAGFGLVSRSVREGALLRALADAGVGCPEFIAAGEDQDGRAFLLMRELSGFVEMRAYLRDHLATRSERRRFARCLGEVLARLHGAGFEHADLYSKHVLVHPATGAIRVLDWQRSRRRRQVNMQRRCRDLAALHATLADDLATPRDRVACLQAYFRTFNGAPLNKKEIRIRIGRYAARLLTRRRIRELRQPPLAAGTQNLVWLNGEALCVTRAFQADLQGRVPPWLAHWDAPPSIHRRTEALTQPVTLFPGSGPATLVRRWVYRPLQQWWDWLRRRSRLAPEVRQAGLIFRLQRYGITTPRLLAVGQRHSFSGRSASFLLTQHPTDSVPLTTWLATATVSQRRAVIRSAAKLLRRLHTAGCELNRPPGESFEELFRIGLRSHEPPAVILGSVASLRIRRHSGSVQGLKDVAALRRWLPPGLCSRTEQLRFLLAYLGVEQLTPAAQRLARKLARESRGARRAFA